MNKISVLMPLLTYVLLFIGLLITMGMGWGGYVGLPPTQTALGTPTISETSQQIAEDVTKYETGVVMALVMNIIVTIGMGFGTLIMVIHKFLKWRTFYDLTESIENLEYGILERKVMVLPLLWGMITSTINLSVYAIASDSVSVASNYVMSSTTGTSVGVRAKLLLMGAAIVNGVVLAVTTCIAGYLMFSRKSKPLTAADLPLMVSGTVDIHNY